MIELALTSVLALVWYNSKDWERKVKEASESTDR